VADSRAVANSRRRYSPTDDLVDDKDDWLSLQCRSIRPSLIRLEINSDLLHYGGVFFIRQDKVEEGFRRKGTHKRKWDETHACEPPAIQGGETGERDLENLELDIDALRHAVINRWDDGRNCAEGEGGEEVDEAALKLE
jgi:hypothetical protein